MTNTQRDASDVDYERRDRALTDSDIRALADELERQLTERFYTNLGRGLWSIVWRALVGAAVALAAYGAAKGKL